MSYFLDYLIFGAQAVPFMATTLAIHLINVVLLFMLCHRMLHRVLPSVAAAVLFGISPLHAEATLWAAARPDSMLLLFTLAPLLNFVGGPLSERLVRVSEADPGWLMKSEPTVLVFSDAGFRIVVAGRRDEIRARLEDLGRLPAGVEACRFVGTRDGRPLDRVVEAAESTEGRTGSP